MLAGGRGGYIPYITNSHAIRQEIQRFESVHPSIYAIYDLIDLVPDPHLAQQIREHVVCIEDSFVNSQEWTLSRAVPDLRLGIVGSLSSGKSALVHRYLTGSYMQEESPEGGRFKKEVVVDGQSYLLLIRDEGGPPELQFTSWVDAIIFVFSLENDNSFSAIYNYYAKMAQFRNIQEIPLILVGTQDAICEKNPRLIEDGRARKLAADLKRCAYYETCATYGLNVERVFQDACQKIVQVKGIGSRPTTPNSFVPRPFTNYMSSPTNGYANTGLASHSPLANNYPQSHSPAHSAGVPPPPSQAHQFLPPKDNRLSQQPPGVGSTNNIASLANSSASNSNSSSGVIINPIAVEDFRSRVHDRVSLNQDRLNINPDRDSSGHRISLSQQQQALLGPTAGERGLDRLDRLDRMGLDRSERTAINSSGSGSGSEGNTSKFLIPGDNKENIGRGELPTPSSTPTSVRKNRRRSNLFTPSTKGKNEEKKSLSGEKLEKGEKGEVGSGRSIPIRQGYLYKKSNKSFSKDWKKKYVTLCEDGRMTYHPSLHDYMENIHGKEIPLQYVTVKVPGQGPRGMRTVPVMGNGSITNGGGVATTGENGHIAGIANPIAAATSKERVTLTGYEMLREGSGGEEAAQAAENGSRERLERLEGRENGGGSGKQEQTTPNVKKRHRRVKSSNVKGGGEEEETWEFQIVSLDNKNWYFEASSLDERDLWVGAIEEQILNSLQGNESSKCKGSSTLVDQAAINRLRSEIPGNTKCVDCDSPNPDWASLNLGVLVCIECSGIHRNLGSHISRVRSLNLDEWPPGHLAVMTSLGNQLANSIWEHSIPHPYRKPTPETTREERERYIKAKYERKEFLAPLPPSTHSPAQSLVDSICRSDMVGVSLSLAHCDEDEVNTVVSSRDARTPLHLAAALGHLAIAQILIWANCNVKNLDHEGRSCLSHARSSGAQDVCDLLVSTGCPEGSVTGTLTRRRGSFSGGGSGVTSVGRSKEVSSSVL